MDTYIANLIKNNNRVILPDFGAFIAKQDQTRTITFNEFLKFNDGLLISYVAEKEKTDKTAAKDIVNEYIQSIKDNLDNKKRFTIHGLGDLFLDHENKIQFTPEGKAKSSSGYAEPEPILKKPEDKKVVPPPMPSPKPAKSKNTIAETNNTAEKENPPAPQKPAEPAETEKKKPAAPAAPPPPPPKRPSQNTASAKKPAQEREKKGGSKKVLAVLLILALLGALITAYFLFFEDNVKDYLAGRKDKEIPVEQEQTSSEEPVTSGGPVQKSGEVSDETELRSGNTTAQPAPSAANNQQNTASDRKKYQIVAGCFMFERNAKNYREKLENEGYDARIFGKVGRLHGVSFERYSSRQEAINALRRIQQQREPKAWIRYQ